MLSLTRADYVVLQEAPTSSIFFCAMARTQATSHCKSVFYCQLQEATMTTIVFIMSYYDEQAMTTRFFMSHHKGEQAKTKMCSLYCKGESKDNKKLNIVSCKVDCKGMIMKGLPCNNQIFICCRLQWSQQWACNARSDDNNNVVFMPWYCTTRLIAAMKYENAPCNYQTFLIDCWSNQDAHTGNKAPVIKNIHDCHCRECNGEKNYVVLQGATMTVDCNKSARSHNDNQPFSLMWMNHIDNHKGAKRQQ